MAEKAPASEALRAKKLAWKNITHWGFADLFFS